MRHLVLYILYSASESTSVSDIDWAQADHTDLHLSVRYEIDVLNSDVAAYIPACHLVFSGIIL